MKDEIARTANQFDSAFLPLLRAEGILLSESRILEVGSGWGKNLLALKSMGATNLVGVDISEEQILQGHALGLDNLRLVRSDDELHQVLGNERYDIIIAIDVLEHLSLPQLESLSRSIRKLLRPGGLLVLEVPNDLAPLNPIKYGDITHLRSFTPASIIQFFRLCGLNPLLIRGLGFPGQGLKFIVRKLLIKWLVGPAIVLFFWIMYGRLNFPKIYEPNLFAVGKCP